MILYFGLFPYFAEMITAPFQGFVVDFGYPHVGQAPQLGFGPRRPLFLAATNGFPASYWPNGNG